MLTLVDFFGASMIALVLGIAELYTIGWIYGTDRLCKDIEFMLGRKVGLYWRLCWGVFTPLIMTIILIYFYATYEPLIYNNQPFPTWAYGESKDFSFNSISNGSSYFSLFLQALAGPSQPLALCSCRSGCWSPSFASPATRWARRYAARSGPKRTGDPPTPCSGSSTTSKLNTS